MNTWNLDFIFVIFYNEIKQREGGYYEWTVIARLWMVCYRWWKVLWKFEIKFGKTKKLGFTAIWLPPVCKATGTNDVGYGIYDLYDLGEFNQKGSIRTKYGTKEELLNLINKAHELGISIYLDVILNHKAGADEVEIFKAIEVSAENREDEIGEERDIGGWTKFTFPNRNKNIQILNGISIIFQVLIMTISKRKRQFLKSADLIKAGAPVFQMSMAILII